MNYKTVLGLLTFVFLLFLSACTTVPVTGRKALHLYSDGQLAQMAARQFGELKKETPLSTNQQYIDRVRRVGARIAPVAEMDLPNVKWEFVVFDDSDQINAFAMPGGKVGIYSGLFKVAKTDADLAVVIGHEIAHVVAKHGSERITQQMLAAGGALAVTAGTRDMDAKDRNLILAGFGVATSVGVLLPYSRLHESEADAIGILYVAEAGYDPRVALSFWQRMSERKSGSMPELLSTHPADSTRMRRLEAMMPQAVEIYETVR
jgi:predicted Zn-dependent protease